MLAEVVEKLRKTGVQAAPPPALCYAGPGDVACDVCTGTRKQKALMSCLVCLASYCETHLQPHYESPAFKKHKLVKTTAQLQEKICSHHDKLLEVLSYQLGHDTVSARAERTEKPEGVTRASARPSRMYWGASWKQAMEDTWSTFPDRACSVRG